MSPDAERQQLSDVEWGRVEAIITAFESAWVRGERPAIGDHIAAASPHRVIVLVELVHADIEFRIKLGEAARVETYLAAHPELDQWPEVVLGLIRTEWEIRTRRESDLTIESFVARFPGLRGELAAALGAAGSGRTTTPALPEKSSVSPFDGSLPRSLGKYELRQKLGCGSFGFVFRGWDPVLQHDVAIKIPRPEVAASPTDVLHFLREARNAILLRHPNIVAIQDAGPIDGTICLVSEFIEGMTLAERLRVGPLGVAEAVGLMVLVLEALSHAHRRGIVHRDLKPSNILLDRDEVPHLTDFGLAKRATGDSTLSPQGATRVLIGTPAYMAPEQARGDSANVDPRSDVYTAGVVLYEMLTGSVPFRGRGRLLQVQIEEAEPPPLRELNDEIPPDLATICLRALAKHPADRYPSAAAMADDLASFGTGRPISARPIAPPVASFWERRRRGITRAAVALAVVAVLAVLGVQWRRADRRAANDTRLIEQLVTEIAHAADVPYQAGASPEDEHRRMADAIRGRADEWSGVLADRPELADVRADFLIQAARDSAALGADHATRLAWEQALAALEPLARGRPAPLRRRADLARALTSLGELNAQAGRRDEGRKLSERGASTWAKLANVYRGQCGKAPDLPTPSLNLAEAILEADRAARNSNRGVMAADVDEAEQIVDRLARRCDSPPDEVARVVAIQLELARRDQSFGQMGPAARWGQQALGLLDASRRRGADFPSSLVQEARATLLVGLCELDPKADPEPSPRDGTATMLDSAIAKLHRAINLDPIDLDLRRDLATAEAGLARLLVQRGRRDQAARWYRHALDDSETRRRARPQAHGDLAASAEIRAGLALVEADRGRRWSALAQMGTAVFQVQRAIWLAPGVGAYRRARHIYLVSLARSAFEGPPLASNKRRSNGRSSGSFEVELH